MKKFCNASTLFLFFLISIPAFAAADEKNLTGRLGLGFTNQIAVSSDGTIPALDAKYYLSKFFATSVGLGFDTRSSDSRLGLGVKLYRTLFLESNLVFYGGGGAAYVSHSGSKTQFSLFLGSEFFFSQLPSLGFSFEAGVRGDNTTGSFAIRTTGDSFLTAGMHFYF